jgi:hypothetical protein
MAQAPMSAFTHVELFFGTIRRALVRNKKEVPKMKKKDETPKEFRKIEREILAMRRRILQWNLEGLTSEELHEIDSALHKVQERFKGRQVEKMAKREQENRV